MGLFKAKAILSIEELNDLGIKHQDGWVEGNLVWSDGEPFIIGDVAEVTDECFAPEFWVAVDKNTITNKLLQTLQDFVNNGVVHDIEPTITINGDYIGLHKYLKSIDDYVRNKAKKALEFWQKQ